jgi:hypothetical protein
MTPLPTAIYTRVTGDPFSFSAESRLGLFCFGFVFSSKESNLTTPFTTDGSIGMDMACFCTAALVVSGYGKYT